MQVNWILAYVCIQSVFTALLIWYIARREKKREEQEKARGKGDLLQVKSTHAAISIAEATAEAVQRIDPNCNGNMDSALAYAREIKREQRDFLFKQGVKNLL